MLMLCLDSRLIPFNQAAAPRAAETSPPCVVGLSEAQLLSAQQMARRMSMVMALHGHGSSGELSRHSSRGGSQRLQQGGGSAPRLSPLAEDGGAVAAPGGSFLGPSPPPPPPPGSVDGSDRGSGGKSASGACKPSRKASLGTAALHSAGGSGSIERREWVLAKLRALVDSVEQLEAAATREREQPFQGGLWGLVQ
jgi:hypothetical protein